MLSWFDASACVSNFVHAGFFVRGGVVGFFVAVSHQTIETIFGIISLQTGPFPVEAFTPNVCRKKTSIGQSL